MSNKKISQLPDNATPNADGTSVAAVTGATSGGTTTFTNERVTVRNLVKAGVQAGGVGLSTVATTGSYTNLTNVPATFPPSSHNHDDRYYTETETDALLAGKQPTGTYATLDGTGRVPAAQLPSYVDDVEEYANLAALPNPGQQGKIYVALDTNKIYRWSATTYLEISPSPGSTDSVAEGAVNLYYTNARASAAAPVQSVAGRTGAVALVKGDVGLGNVDNTSDASKPISTATQTALDGKAAATHTHAASSVVSGTFDIARIPTGTTASTVCAGNDPRLSDSRAPTGAAGGDLTGTYPNPQIAAGAVVTADLANDAVTYAKLQNVSATDRLLGRSTAGAGDVEEITCTAFARSILDDADAGTSRTTLGLGTIATQNANSVAITGGSINGTAIGATTASTGAFTTVTTTGNVGIGTTIPSGRLHVDGGALFVGRYGQVSAIAMQYANGTSTAPTAVTAATIVASTFFRSYDGAIYRDVAGFGAAASSATTSTSSEGHFYIATTPLNATSSVERMRVDSAGNVGIGTTNPQARLDVRRTNTYALFCDSVFVTAAFGPRETNDGFCTVTHSWTIFGSGNNWQSDYSSGAFTLSRNFSGTRTEMVAVTSAGNVGIGTASPGNKLHVAGSGQGIHIEDTGTNRAVLALFAFNNELRIQGTAYNAATQPLTVWTANLERMRIEASGNVGIGTASPSSRLHVTGGTITTDDWAINPRSIGPETIIEFTGNRTLALTDASRLLVYTGTTAVSVTIPADASVNFPIGTRIKVIHANTTGEMTFLPYGSSTPTIRAAAPNFGPYSKYVGERRPGEVLLTKIAADLWLLTGSAIQS